MRYPNNTKNLLDKTTLKLSLRNPRNKSRHPSQDYIKTVRKQKGKKNKTIHSNHNSSKKATKTTQKLAEKLS